MCGDAGDVAGGVAHVVIAAGYGGPEVLSVVDEPVGDPGPGEVRIEVRAAGVNPVDVKSYSGAFGRDAARLPIRLGAEAAGVVTAVGPDAAGPAGPVGVGDEVIAYRAPGAYAAELVVPARAVIPKPGTLDWPQAAGLLLTGATAWHLLAATAVGAGDTVLVHGGSGGVGLMAVQLAAIRGAKVVATASPARHDLLRDLGAIPVAYGPGLADRVRAAAPGGVDVALDLVGTDEAWDVSFALVADKARIATIVAFARGLEAGIKVLGGAPGADPGTEIRERARLELAKLARDGKLRVIVSQTFPLAETPAAHRAILDGHTTGKIALIP
jgi:NADPH2:quinone reductase